MRSLRFDGCHLRSIPTRAFWGLSNLVSLTVVTRNAGVLAVEAGAFAGLDSLEKLDLSGNYIRHLAPGVLCSLPKLTVLNLSKNEIGSLSDLGLLEVSFFYFICIKFRLKNNFVFIPVFRNSSKICIRVENYVPTFFIWNRKN